MNRVVVTGYGCLSALGQNAESFSQNILDGVCGIGPIQSIDSWPLRTKIAAQVPDYEPLDHFQQRKVRYIDRFAQFAVVATREAVAHAGLSFDEQTAQRTGIVLGTGAGGQITQDESYQRLYGDGKHTLHPFTVPKLMASAGASHVSMDLGVTGPAFATTSACASSSHAIIVGMMMIQAGLVDVALVGGSEAIIAPGPIVAWESLRVMAKDTCRPFSAQRGGIVLGEGGGALVLESLDHARSRGVHILAELTGAGMTADAGNLVEPALHGPARAMQQALANSGLAPTDIQYVNAHGTGTARNDPVETAAIHAIFGDHARRLVVSSTKSMVGHTLGASGALEAIASVMALQAQVAPPTMNYLGPDPECDLDYAPNAARPMRIEGVMSNSFAFGGLNTALIFRHSDLL